MEDIQRLVNDEEVKGLIPLIIFLVIIIVTGIPGNLFICAMYSKSYKKSSSRFFILALAIVDCIGCCMVSLEVSNIAQQYTFTNVHLCKATIFLELWPILTSGCLLLIISVDRHRKVCYPFGWQLSFRSGQILFAFSAVISLLCSFPALILYGITEVRSHSRNVTGTECSILAEYKDSAFSKAYNGMFLIQFVFAFALLSIMYSLICIRVMRHEKNTKQNKFDRANDVSERRNHYQNGEKQTRVQAQWKDGKNSKIRKTSDISQRSDFLKTSARLTCTMCIISVVFIISFLPYTILRILESYKENFLEFMTDTDRALYKTFLRTYFLNCAINPVVYCVCSRKFRMEFIKCFRSIICRN